MARRRLDVQAALRTRRRLVLLVAVGVVGLVVAVVAVLRSPLLDVDTVLVAGSTTVDRAEVARASGVRRGDAMVDVDPVSARAAVMALPGVASARVERDWPGRVRISITDEVPILVVESAGSAWVVGRGGRVLESVGVDPSTGQPPPAESPTDQDRSSLLKVSVDPSVLTDGADPLRPGQQVPRSFAGTVLVAEQMSTTLREKLAGVEVAGDGSLTLVLHDDAGRVAFGRPEAVPAKLMAIDSVLAGVDLTCMDVLDVSEPSRPTVSRRDGCRVNPPTVGDPAPSGAAGQPAAAGAQSRRTAAGTAGGTAGTAGGTAGTAGGTAGTAGGTAGTAGGTGAGSPEGSVTGSRGRASG